MDLTRIHSALSAQFPALATPEGEAQWRAALRRRAFVKEQQDRLGPPLPDHESLEWLGDRVLNVAAAELLWRGSGADRSPGTLTEQLKSRVDARHLAAIGRSIRLGEHIEAGRGELLQGQHLEDKPLSDHVEALVGACFLAGGWECACALVQALLEVDVSVDVPGAERGLGAAPDEGPDPKSALNLAVQRVWKQPLGKGAYSLVARWGPDHQPTFTYEVELPDGTSFVGASAGSKADAERAAARVALATHPALG